MHAPKYKNPLISTSLTDETEISERGAEVYTHDCHNLPICGSYGQTFFACLAGANAGTRSVNDVEINGFLYLGACIAFLLSISFGGGDAPSGNSIAEEAGKRQQ